MKAGCIITANVTENGLNDVSVNRIGANHGKDEWTKAESEERLTVNDATDLVDLMVEGIMTVIYCAHDTKIKDSAEFMRETIEKLQNVFIQPADTSITIKDEGTYSVR